MENELFNAVETSPDSLNGAQTAENTGGDFSADAQQPVQNAFEPNSGIPTYDSSEFMNFTPTGAVAKRSFLPLKIILAVVLTAALCVGAYFLYTTFMTSSYQKAEQKFINSSLSSMLDMNDKVKEIPDFYNENVEIKLTPTANLLEQIGITEEINPTVFNISAAASGDNREFILTYKNGEKTVIELDAILTASDFILKVPQLSDIYIVLNDVIKSSDLTDFGDLTTLYNEVVDSFFKKYIEIIGDVPVQKGVTISVGTISQKTDKYTITFDELVLAKVEKALYEVLLESESLRPLLTKYLEKVKALQTENLSLNASYYIADETGGDSEEEDKLTVEYFYKSLEEAKAKAITKISELEAKEKAELKVEFVMDVFASGSDIVARSITADDGTLDYKTLKNGDQYADEFVLTVKANIKTEQPDDTGLISMSSVDGLMSDQSSDVIITYTNIGKVSNNTYTGEVEVDFTQNSIQKSTVTAEYTDLAIVDDKYVSGTINLDAPFIGFNSVIELSHNDNTQKVTANAFVGGKNYLDIEVNVTTGDPKTITAPEVSENNAIYPNKTNDDGTISGQYEQFIKDIEKFTGSDASAFIKEKIADANGKTDLLGYAFNILAEEISEYTKRAQDITSESDEYLKEVYKSTLDGYKAYFSADGTFDYKAYCDDNGIEPKEENREYYEQLCKYYIEYCEALLEGDSVKAAQITDKLSEHMYNDPLYTD